MSKGKKIMWKNKKAVSGNGWDHSVDMGERPELVGMPQISVGVWATLKDHGRVKGYETLFGFGGWYAGAGFALLIDDDGRQDHAKVILKTGLGNGNRLTSPLVIPREEKAYILCTFDGTQPLSRDRPRIFINGVDVGGGPNYGGPESIQDPGAGSRLRVLASDGDTIPSMHALMAEVVEVQLWSRILTPQEITAAFKKGKGVDLDRIGLKPDHWWWMGDGDAAPTIIDHGSVGGWDGTILNGAPIV